MDKNLEKNKRRKKYFLMYQLAIMMGYFITQLGTFFTKLLGFSSIEYSEIIIISVLSIGFTLIATIVVFSFKIISPGIINLTVKIQFFYWLIIYMIWIFLLQEARLMGLFFALMPLIFLIINSTYIQSISVLAALTVIHLGASFFGIYIKGQKGSFVEVVLYTAWFLPSALYISYAAGLFYRKRQELKKAKNVAEKTLDALWAEMGIAKKIQTILLPQKPEIPGYDIAHFMEPTDQVGGDYYDIINSDEKNWVTIGDVSGHGVPAGLVMMMVQSSIRSQLMENPSIKPSELLKIVNRSIQYNIKQMKENKFMTITVLSIDKNDNVIFSGKHEDIIVYDSESNEIKEIKTKGILISGLQFKDTDINLEMQIKSGDIVLLYTDGLVEAWEQGFPSTERMDKMFGTEQLKKILFENAKKSPDEIKDILLNRIKDFNVDDDVTFLILKKR